MNYHLKTEESTQEKKSFKAAYAKMGSLMKEEKKQILLALLAIFVSSGMTLLAPLIVGYTIDHYIVARQYKGLFMFGGLLVVIYALAYISSYIQIRVMGAVGQRVLFKLRNNVFEKLQQLPVAFFNQNKAGDLISRINNDTQKLNEFFSQTIMQFAGNAFIIVGAGIFMLAVSLRLGAAALAPAVGLFIMTRLVSSWVKKVNLSSLQAEGSMSAEIQESLGNFKVILAFNRRDYFRKKFEGVNANNFKTSFKAGLANTFFGPVYDFAGNLAQLIVLVYGIYLIIGGHLAIGIMISFLLYTSRFYDPLRQFASLWSTFQVALAGWDRISEILHLDSDLIITSSKEESDHSLLRFKDVAFKYPDGKEVLKNINFSLEKGKTYALVGPTGGGKTTTASLLARLYDPTEGTVYLSGKDIRSYTPEERSKKIGFILQEPFLFDGTVKDNVLYGHPDALTLSKEELMEKLQSDGLEKLLERFEEGLDTKVTSSGDALSLGQKQLLAFMRAVLRNPELLILDEATANIDTVTEQLLEEILKKLPAETTRVIIAHRLNTIESADEIFFVNEGTVTAAGSMEHAVDMLMNNKRQS